jgi:Orsellinic acid/F9775 biosynthesis cluster protein D
LTICLAFTDASHSLDIPPSYTCPICPADCSSLWTLDHHLRVAHNATLQAKPYTPIVNAIQKLRSLKFGYDSRHSILICETTSLGVPKRDVEKHLAKCNHHTTLDALDTLFQDIHIADVDDRLPLEMGAPMRTIEVVAGRRCEKCKLAFTAPPKQPNKMINEHIKKEHKDEAVEKSECHVQKWFGGDSNYRNCSVSAQGQWRYVVVDPRTPDTTSLDPAPSNQLKLFDQMAPPSSAHPELEDVIDRRELGAVIHRLNLARFASADVMRAHLALCHAGRGAGIDGLDLLSLCHDWIKSVQQATDTLPDQVRCWLATLL